MKKILITGFSGFVSNHFLNFISNLNESFEVVGISRGSVEEITLPNLSIKTYQGDIKNTQFIKEIVCSARPNYILHLASDSSVAYSWDNPLESFQNNTNIFLNLVEAVRNSKIKCRILSVGSSEQYGIVDEKFLPLTEESILNPISPYAVARVSQEMLGKIYSKGYGLDIILTRSFNHIGTAQTDKFVVASFVKQIVQRKKENLSTPLNVGNVDIVRDFLDVRDVVKAYWELLLNGESGEIYNICSGKGISLKQIIEKVLHLVDVDFSYRINQDLVRPSDNPIIIGSHSKITNKIGWQPTISIDTSLQDIINYWNQVL